MKAKYLLIGLLLVLLALALAACSSPAPAPTVEATPCPAAPACPECPAPPEAPPCPEPVVDPVPHEDEWVASAHADIENKKMLENAVDHIADENEIEIKPETVSAAQLVEEISEPQIFVQEELTATELDNSVNNFEDSYDKQTLENEFGQELERINNLTEETETVHETINFETLKRVEEEIHEEVMSVQESKPLYAEINFRKGSVDWAFGFN